MEERSLEARVRAHLGTATPHVVHRTFPHWQAADVAIACHQLWADSGAVNPSVFLKIVDILLEETPPPPPANRPPGGAHRL